MSDGIKKRFNETLERKKHAEENVSAGREYVKAYVDFTHFLERIHNNAVGPVAAHGNAGEAMAKEPHARREDGERDYSEVTACLSFCLSGPGIFKK